MSTTPTPNAQTLPAPVGRWVRILDMPHPTLADVELDADAHVTAIHRVMVNGQRLTYALDPDERQLDEVHEQVNRGRWEEVTT